jgi:hypothetical protein
VKRMEVKKKNGEWRAESKGRAVPGTSSPRKTETVKKTAEKARRSQEPVSVRIHKESGKFQEERTYPRGADPSRSRG